MICDLAQKPEYLEFAQRLTKTKSFGACQTIAFVSDGVMAVVVYNAFDEQNCGISIATNSPKWCSRRVLQMIFSYPFSVLKLRRVTATIRQSNEKSRSLVERLGFDLEGELGEYYENGESAMIYGLKKRESRWHEQGRR